MENFETLSKNLILYKNYITEQGEFYILKCKLNKTHIFLHTDLNMKDFGHLIYLKNDGTLFSIELTGEELEQFINYAFELSMFELFNKELYSKLKDLNKKIEVYVYKDNTNII